MLLAYIIIFQNIKYKLVYVYVYLGTKFSLQYIENYKFSLFKNYNGNSTANPYISLIFLSYY